MKTIKEREKLGKYLSYLLRHAPEKASLDMDENGYVGVEQHLTKLDMSKDDLDWIVDNNNKKRFAYNETETLIRANQGHSIDVDVELEEVEPPQVLYHGTNIKYLDSIRESGILKMSRQHVHLTDDEMTAVKVGMRHCKHPEKPLVLEIMAKVMHLDGYKFYMSKNGVYLTQRVFPKYISFTN